MTILNRFTGTVDTYEVLPVYATRFDGTIDVYVFTGQPVIRRYKKGSLIKSRLATEKELRTGIVQ